MVSVAIRSHRILARLTNYQKAGDINSDLAKFADVHLGALIGCYRNPAPQSEEVGIFSNGLAWLHNEQMVTVSFVEIKQVTLLNKKESEGLLLTIFDGQQLQLPMRGQHGRFFDSMEVMRFLDRVMQDEKTPVQSTPLEPSKEG